MTRGLVGALCCAVIGSSGCGEEDCRHTLTCLCSTDDDCTLREVGECHVPKCDSDGICRAIAAPAGTACAEGTCDASGTCTASAGGGGAGGMGSCSSTEPCGDCIVEPPEECDDGSNNGPGQACKADCTLNVCGDGDQGPSEGCDDGARNALLLGSCAPDCSWFIEKRYIVVSLLNAPSANLAPDVVATADSYCPEGYKALFAYSTVRRATVTANSVTNPIDWVLRPYTYYFNADENPIWLTRDVALLGVENGRFVGLENPIQPQWSILEITGLNTDWTTLSSGSENCYGWSNGNSSVDGTFAWAGAEDTEFLKYTIQPISCAYGPYFYCVEQ